MLVSLALVVAALLPQGSQAEAPVGLTVVVVDVGQGDGIVVRAPDGQVHVVDAGPEGEGFATMVPAVQALQPSGYGYAFLSHFHIDHLGGLDDVLAALPFQVALDRGDVARPSNASVNSYLAAAGARRQQIAVGAVYQLGGGATMRCVCANGEIDGGGFVDPANSSQQENSRSVALRLDYGDFSMWFGGDLTGGGATADVESLASLACGDVDVYKLNHHGSASSTNANLVARLAPELAVVSCGVGNAFGHPTTTVVNRLNQAAAARALLSTTTGSANTIGFGVVGDIRIDTDGFRYRATAENGDVLDFYCDEAIPAAIAPGELRISEIMRDPAIVPDTNGEYFEVVNVGSRPAALAGLRLIDNAGVVTIASNFLLVPGRALVFQRDGAPTRNGGQPLGVVFPFNSISLANGNDSITLQHGAATIDSVTYNSLLPGGPGVAAERPDLFAPHLSGFTWNYQAASQPFGAGDLGSPGRANPGDTTVHPVQVGVDVRADRFTLHATALDNGSFFFSVLALSFADQPGIPFGGAVVPLAFDSLFQASLAGPGFLGVMPPDGYRSVDVPIPQPNNVAGVPIFAAHVVLDVSLSAAGVSPAVSFVLP